VLILKVVSWGRIQTVEIASSEANAEALRTRGDCGFITQRTLRAEHRYYGELLVGFLAGAETRHWRPSAKVKEHKEERSLERLVDIGVSRKKESGFLGSLAEARRTTERK